jgi:hypothetical protein
VSLETALHSSSQKMQTLLETLEETRASIDDIPPSGETALTDVFGDATDTLIGWLEESLTVIEDAHRAARNADLALARRGLIVVQERINALSQLLEADLLGYERTSELVQFGLERQGAWFEWAETVKTALERNRAPLHALKEALFICWQELSERATYLSISSRITNVDTQTVMLRSGKRTAEHSRR